MIASGIMLTDEDQADELNARGWRRPKGGGPYTVEAVRRLKRDLGIASLKARRARKERAHAPLRERVHAERKVTRASARVSELNNKRGSGGPSQQFTQQLAERRAHVKRKFDGLARHGVKGPSALAEAANKRGIQTLSGKGVWTKGRVERLYRKASGRRPPAPGPKFSDDDIAEIVALRREGQSLAAIAFFMRLSQQAVSRILQRETAKTTVE